MESEIKTPGGRRYPLIGPEDPPPFSIHNAEGDADVLVVCDHASRAIPAEMQQLGLDDWVLDQHVAWDIGSADVGKHLATALGAPAILCGYSRLLVDPNRQLYDSTAFVEVSDGIAIPGNLDLCDEDRDKRAKSFFEPYHEAIATKLTELSDRGVSPALISVHSCTPVFNEVIRPWHVGVLWDKDPRIAKPLLAGLAAADGVCVGDNEPYSGAHPHDFTIDHHAESRGLPHVGMEVRQDLIDTPSGARKWAEVIAQALIPILEDRDLYRPLGQFAKARSL